MVVEFKPGDVLGFSTWSRGGVAINLATAGVPFWSLSHVEIIAGHPGCYKHLVAYGSSYSEAPCLFRREVVYGVQAHEIADRLNGDDCIVWLYPLAKPLGRLLSEKLADLCYSLLGTVYDRTGSNAARDLCGGLILKLLFSREDLTQMFCSEFVAYVLREVGAVPVRNASAWSPNQLTRFMRYVWGACGKPILLSRPRIGAGPITILPKVAYTPTKGV